MADSDGTQPTPPGALAGSWQAALFLGAATLIFGLIVTLHPSGSVNVSVMPVFIACRPTGRCIGRPVARRR